MDISTTANHVLSVLIDRGKSITKGKNATPAQYELIKLKCSMAYFCNLFLDYEPSDIANACKELLKNNLVKEYKDKDSFPSIIPVMFKIT